MCTHPALIFDWRLSFVSQGSSFLWYDNNQTLYFALVRKSNDNPRTSIESSTSNQTNLQGEFRPYSGVPSAIFLYVVNDRCLVEFLVFAMIDSLL